MKDRIKNSFRVRMVGYALVSMVLALLTEALVVAGMFAMLDITRGSVKEEAEEIAYNIAMEKAEEKGDKKREKDFWEEEFREEEFRKEEAEVFYWDAIQKMRKFRKEGLIGFLFFVCFFWMGLFILYFMLLTRSFAKYLRYIKEGILTISHGELNTKLEVKGEDEVAIIAKQINIMAEDLQKLMEMERSMEKQKNELITSVAHDLRTPLTSILGYLELLKNKKDISPEEKEKYIQITYDKSVRLKKLIEDLFDFTKLDTGEIELHKNDIDMVKLVEQMVEEFYPIFEDSGLACEFETTVESAIISADGELMARAVENLFSNAVRYGKDGKKIRIHIETKLDSVWISVINYGILIPEESLSHVFERFYRVETSRNQHTGGTGLGLNIVQKIIGIHEGKIFADSGTQGTRFRIVLPLKETEEFSDKIK